MGHLFMVHSSQDKDTYILRYAVREHPQLTIQDNARYSPYMVTNILIRSESTSTMRLWLWTLFHCRSDSLLF